MDMRRLEHVKGLHNHSGLDTGRARIKSYRDYSLFCGLQQLWHQFTPAEFDEVLRGVYAEDKG
jgi:hypothetical protein